MSFVDEIKIYAKAGDGGNGIVAWRREKFIAMGGPAGGDGGNGGDVYFRAVRNLNRLSDYTARPKFFAENGGNGMKKSMEGKNGDDLYIEIPVGSVVSDEIGNAFSMLKAGEEVKILSAGKGGYGNEHFKSSKNVAPEEQTDGTEGEEGSYKIELEMMVDLGFVGLPSAGKSSLLNALTKSTKAKVGEYPFTTLEPSLGAFYGFILADIPGLIEGASEGKGLGYKFLRHIKRTKAIAHLVSFEYEDMDAEYNKIRKELEVFSDSLVEKKEVIVLSKSDMTDEKRAKEMKKFFEDKYSKPVFLCSVIDDDQLKKFGEFLTNFLI